MDLKEIIKKWYYKDLRNHLGIPAMLYFLFFLLLQAIIYITSSTAFFSFLKNDVNLNIANSVSHKIDSFFEDEINKFHILFKMPEKDVVYIKRTTVNFLLTDIFFQDLINNLTAYSNNNLIFKNITFIDINHVKRLELKYTQEGELKIERSSYDYFPLFASPFKSISIALVKNSLGISPIQFFDKDKKIPYVFFIFPLLSFDLQLIGYLYGEINLAPLFSELNSLISNDDQLFIVDKSYNYIALHDTMIHDGSEFFSSEKIDKTIEGSFFLQSHQHTGNNYSAVFYPITKYLNWCIVLEHLESGYIGFLQKIIISYVFISIIIILTILIFFSKVINQAITPIKVLSTNAGKISLNGRLSGDVIIDAETKSHTTGEIKILVDSFNNMIQTLKEAENKALNEQEKRYQQEQLMIQQSKLAAMGEMISMIAHQWRQPLSSVTTIAGNLRVLLELEQYDKAEFLDMLDNINNQSQFLSTTINDFRGFFKLNEPAKEAFVTDVMEKTLGIIGKSLQYKYISIIKDYRINNPIQTNANELMQVFLNILKNAYDAIIQNQTKEPVINLNLYEQGDFQIIEISDNGGGIKTDNIDDIFKPYFTTKEESKGTGLGLYISKIIITDHFGGTLTVKNREAGALFTIQLPYNY